MKDAISKLEFQGLLDWKFIECFKRPLLDSANILSNFQ